MQKNNSNYTFLLSHTTKDKIYIRRFEISKKLLHSSAVSLILCLGIASFGIFGLFNDNSNVLASSKTDSSTQKVKQTEEFPIEQTQRFNYDRPESSDEYSINSGGPTAGSYQFQLATVSSDSNDSALEKRLQGIESNSNPQFLPTIWSHLGKINNEYGFRRNPFGGRSYEFHAGMDIDGNRGDMIVAPANAIVKKAGWQGGYGYMIELDHGNGLTTRFGHLSRIEVNEGEMIQRGQLMGLIGSTGRSTGPHLHYELRLDNKPINPRRFLPPQPNEIRN
ncbi:MAG: M23 family metallopeptidase [Acidobacteriota bacterium]|jgi:murein DD-endopeptidase MepM/ murein hydrolase activator NlpD|nr:M23 family metallopeptidase [Acidobacteriota bacterium]